MSWPIDNYIHVKSDKKTFENIVNMLVDEKNDITTYEKFCTAEEIKAFDVTCGHFIIVDLGDQSIRFITNFDPAVPIVAKLATLFPEATFEYGYERADDKVHDMFDIYSGGELVRREDVVETWDDDEEDEEEDE